MYSPEKIAALRKYPSGPLPETLKRGDKGVHRDSCPHCGGDLVFGYKVFEYCIGKDKCKPCNYALVGDSSLA